MVSMTFEEYQRETRKTAIYPFADEVGSYEGLSYAALGLAGEAGEVAGKVKKIYRDDGGHISPERAAAILDECGDVMWYLSRIADHLESELSGIALNNVRKLEGRLARGTIGGSGDNR